MTSGVKVVGLVQASNEWPVLALSISHALMHHVDEVYVLNHSSTDGTHQGLRELRELWPGRLEVVEYDDEHFWQEACLSTLIEVCQRSSPEWIYVFDADEFLLTRDAGSLKDVLGSVGSQSSVVRYEVQNWVSPVDFDETDFAAFDTLRYRAEPNLFLDVPSATCVDEIRHGNMNYFDVPFGSKVIVRNTGNMWVAAGAHGLKAPSAPQAGEVESDAIVAAHLPFLSRRRLALKARQGQLIVQDRFPADHAWQSQLIWGLSHEGEVDEFWRTHSVAVAEEPVDDRALPSVVVDDALVNALGPVLRLLKDVVGNWSRERVEDHCDHCSLVQGPVSSQIAFRTSVHSARKLQLIADSLLQERDVAESSCAEARTEAGRLRAELERLRVDLIATAAQITAVRESASWQLTGPARAAGRAVRRMMARMVH